MILLLIDYYIFLTAYNFWLTPRVLKPKPGSKPVNFFRYLFFGWWDASLLTIAIICIWSAEQIGKLRDDYGKYVDKV